MTEAKLELIEQDISTGWALYRLLELEVTVTTSPASYESRKVTATLSAENAPLKVAIPLFPGNGPVPENALQLQNVADQAQLVIQTLENAIEESVKEKNEGKGW